MKNIAKFSILLLPLLLMSCNGSDKSLLEILPKNLDSLSHILKYLILVYVQMALIRLLFSFVFGIKININLILLILFLYIYYSNDFGFFKLFIITFLPNIIYLIYLYLKNLYSTK